MRHTFRLVFPTLLLTVLSGACHDAVESVIPSTTQTTLGSIAVSPSSSELSVVAPGNTVALTTTARNERGLTMGTAGAVVTYSSSAPASAGVSSSGIVTGRTPGNAVITVEMTLRGVTRSATMTVVVLGPGSWPAVGGVYDLVSTITHSDPIWGIPDGTQQLATLTIQHTGDTSPFTGTFSDLRVVEPGGLPTPYPQPPGSISGTVQRDGRIVLALTNAGQQGSYWDGRGTLTGQAMSGTYGAGGHISGTFIATRR